MENNRDIDIENLKYRIGDIVHFIVQSNFRRG